MKRTLVVSFFLLILVTGQSGPALAQQADRQADDRPATPFQVFDNLYYVGFESACAWVLKTSEGLILIDTGYVQFEDHIPQAMQQLGLDPKDIKYIFINHAHTDHTGAANALKKLTGARIGMAEGDWEFQAAGTYMNSQGIPRHFTPIPRDMIIKDLDTFRLGDTTLTFHVLPGHTPGDTTIEFDAIDQGKRYKTFLFSGLGTALTGVNAAEAHLARVRRIMAVPDVQVTLSDHTAGIQLFEKAAKLKTRKPGDPHPFVLPEEFRAAMQPRIAAAERKLAAERAANRP